MYGLLSSTILYPIFYIWPAYVANGLPVIFGRGKNRLPLDLNKRLWGKPIFGAHKTVRGLAGGLACGIIMSAIESIFAPYMLAVGTALTVGTHIGDLAGSFAKRRMGSKPGTRMYLLDQYTFLAFALIVAYPLGHMPSALGIVFIILLTGILHPLTNFFAHRLKIKEVPW
ncbi:MAG: CDP-archaeol synthase [Candidatus Micrarchaeaceae archaeon]